MNVKFSDPDGDLATPHSCMCSASPGFPTPTGSSPCPAAVWASAPSLVATTSTPIRVSGAVERRSEGRCRPTFALSRRSGPTCCSEVPVPCNRTALTGPGLIEPKVPSRPGTCDARGPRRGSPRRGPLASGTAA